jgi:hypothetical protein
MAVKSKLRKTSVKLMGHQPMSLRAWEKDESSLATMTQSTATLQRRHDSVTARILALITDGASRLRVADGRIDGET